MEHREPTHESPTARFWYLRTADDTDGELHEQRVEYAPGSPFPIEHFHPAQAEHFEIERGAMLVVVDGQERTLGAGETLEVPAGSLHKMRNASDSEVAVVRWETRPALRTAEFFAVADALGADAGLLDQGLLATEYRDVFRPAGLLGSLVPVVGGLARLLGRRLPSPE
jgi:mannose-6-phosphate isomerase-like protein (cupin superfamily)